MGDVAKGIKSFKKGMAEEETAGRQTGRAGEIDRPSGARARLKQRAEAGSKV